MIAVRFSIILVALGFAFHSAASAQGADGRSPMVPSRDAAEDDRPKSIRETLEKLRIEKEKKEFDEMIGRGEEAVRISEELEKAFDTHGRLESEHLTKVAAVEKLAKKIRSELGGGDGEEEDEKPGNAAVDAPPERGEIVKTLRSATSRLLDELKKTSRFTVSAAAIQSSNSVIKLARFLRISR